MSRLDKDKPKYIFNQGTRKFEGLTPEDDKKIKFDEDRGIFIQPGTGKKGALTDFKLGEVQFGEPSTWNMKADEFMQKRAAERNQVNEFSKIVPNLQGKKKKINYNKKKPLSDIDILYAAGSPKEKREMRQQFKDYNFHKRKFKEDIRNEAIARMKINPMPIEIKPEPKPEPIKVPEKDIREIINERAAAAAKREKENIVKQLGTTGLGAVALRNRGLLDD